MILIGLILFFFIYRKGHYKLYMTQKTTLLFNISTDPHELINIAKDYPEIQTELYGQLLYYVTEKEPLKRPIRPTYINQDFQVNDQLTISVFNTSSCIAQ